MYRFVEAKASLKDLEKSVKNKFRWDWLSEEVESKSLFRGKTLKGKIGDCIRKVDVAGRAQCTWCNDVINYEAAGKKVSVFVYTSSGDLRKILNKNYMIITDKTAVPLFIYC
jgi:hypothetical protein